jgi:hypothetical protein
MREWVEVEEILEATRVRNRSRRHGWLTKKWEMM